MDFALLLTYVAIYIIRPSEWVPGMIGTPLLMTVGLLSIVVIVFGVVSGKYSTVLSGNVEVMMLGFIASICLSHISHGYIGGATGSMEKFLPSMVGFFLVITSINDRKRFDLFILVLIALVSFVAYEGIQQFRTGYSIGGMEPFYQSTTSIDGELIRIPRIRWYGLFNDPNDLGILLILIIPFLINMLLQRKILIPIISFSLVIPALYYTNSRGSMLAGAISICTYFLVRYRSKKGLILGLLLVVPLFIFGPSRLGDMSGKEESAYGRIESWYQGYQMFKSNPLFGVGMGSYTDYHYLTAHNSFVLVMAELGFVGLLFFTGLFYFALHWLYSFISNSDLNNINSIDIGLISACHASLSGVLIAIFFLSRSYTLIPYVIIAYTITANRLIAKEYNLSWLDDLLSKKHIKAIALLTVMQIIIINIIVKAMV